MSSVIKIKINRILTNQSTLLHDRKELRRNFKIRQADLNITVNQHTYQVQENMNRTRDHLITDKC